MTDHEDKRLFTLSQAQADAIQKGLAGCDGRWMLAVRTGEDWQWEHLQSLLESATDSLNQEGVEGFELGLVFH